MSRYDSLADLMQGLTILVLFCAVVACVVVIGYAVVGALPAVMAWIDSGAWAG